MTRSKQGQVSDLLTIFVGILVSIIYFFKAEYIHGLVILGLSISCVCSYKIKYKYNKLF
jgi:hypothetical protein